MAEQKTSGYVKQQTLFTAVAVTFVVGFMCGVILTAYRTAPLQSERAAADPHPEHMVDSLEEQVVQEPDNVEAWLHLGNAYFDGEQYQKAISAYEKAIALDPENADAMTDMGVMYRRIGQPRKAVAVFDAALEKKPDHEIARFNKGIVLMFDLKEKEKALASWRKLLEINPLFMTPGGQSLESLIRTYAQETAG